MTIVILKPFIKYFVCAILVLLLQVNSCLSQHFTCRFSAEFLFGASILVGRYGSKAANGLYAENKPQAPGLVKVGPSFQLDMDYLMRL
jgi:hypothetical protein